MNPFPHEMRRRTSGRSEMDLEGHDQFFDTIDMMFLMVDTAGALEDIEPLETVHGACSISPHDAMRLSASSLYSSDCSNMAPTMSSPMSQTAECKESGYGLANCPTFNPPYPPMISEEDDSNRGKFSDVHPFIITDDLREAGDHGRLTNKGRSNNVCQYSHKELHSLHTRVLKRAPSPTRNETQLRRIWGVSTTGKNIESIGTTKAHKQRSGVDIAPHPPSEAGKTTPADIFQSRSHHDECTLLEHLDSENSDGLNMEDSLLDGISHDLKMTRCKKKCKNLVSERHRRSKLNDKLFSLRALVPKISKMDKASIVGDAISYMRELKRQVEEVEKDVSHLAATQEAIANGLIIPKIPFTHSPPPSSKTVHHYQIVKFDVTHMEGQHYHLRVHCKRGIGIMLKLAQAIQTLEFEIICANFSTINDNILNNLVIEVKQEHFLRKEEVHCKTMEAMLRFGFTYDLQT